MADRLHVLMGGRIAGSLIRRGRSVVLEYDEGYMATPDAHPLSLSLPLERRRHAGDTVGNWLAGLLPDDYAMLDRWAMESGAASAAPFDLLATRIGWDCAGAVRFSVPGETERLLSRGGDVEPVSDDAVRRWMKVLAGDRFARLHSPHELFSLGGYQAKRALHRDDSGWGIPRGETPTTHILKPPALAVGANQAVIEHATMRAAAGMGLLTANTELLEYDGGYAIVVERYDREATGPGLRRIHQEDICQALGRRPDNKYQAYGGPSPEQIADLLWEHADAESVERFRDALIVNWLLVGTDAHAKNYSIVFLDGGPILAPAYDVCSYLPYHTRLVSETMLAMRIGADHTVAAADRIDAWEATARSLGLDVGDTLDMAARMAEAAPDALADAARDLPSGVCSSSEVNALITLGARRAEACQRIIRRR